jgi:RHS repeat-associated protein
VLTVQAVMPTGTPSQTTQYVYGVTTAGGSGVNSNDLVAAVYHPDPTTGNASSGYKDQYTYNALGQVATYTDRNGNVHTYSYDVLGRQTSDTITTLGTGVDGGVRRLDTAYDTQGNAYLLTSYSDTAGTTIVNQVQRTFNGLGQLTNEYQSHSGAVNTSTTPQVQYAYNLMSGGANNSRLTSMTYPNGRVLNYNYNTGLDSNISRLSSISDTSGTLESWKYLGLGTVVERDHSQNSVNETLISQTGGTGDGGDKYTGLDRFGRMVEQLWYNTSTSSATDDFQYTFDRDSNVTAKTNVLHTAFNETDGYDGLNRLTSFARGSTTTVTWAIDGDGNFSTVTTNSTPVSYTANAQNEYTAVGAASPLYDANGNMTKDANGNTYVYDAWNRLVKVKNSGGTTLTTYGYDALGRRITENPGTQRDLYYNAQWQVIEERLGGSSNAQTQYVWDPLATDTLVLRDRSPTNNGTLSERLYVQQDANGNVTALVDTSGTVKERYAIDAYGNVLYYDGSWNSLGSSAYAWMYLFQGMRLDTVVGLYDFRNRIYSAALARFLQNDPAGFDGSGPNLYEHEGDNPINGSDPTGLTDPDTLFPRPQRVLTPDELANLARALLPGSRNNCIDDPEKRKLPSGLGTLGGGGSGFLDQAPPFFAAAAGNAGWMIQGIGEVAVSAPGFVADVFTETNLILYDGGRLIAWVLAGSRQDWKPTLYSNFANQPDRRLNTLTLGMADWWNGTLYAVDQASKGNTKPAAKLVGGGFAVYFVGRFLNRWTGGQKSCFPAGTLVHSSVGLKAIEQIAVGDRVWAYDHCQLRWAEREVVEVYQLPHQGTMVTIYVGGVSLRATGGHPFWVVRGLDLAERPKPVRIAAYADGGRQKGRWVLARDFKVGDEVLLRQGEVATLESVSLHEVEEQVYNFHVAELQNYAVGECGVLVHNTNDPPAAPASYRGNNVTATSGNRVVSDFPGGQTAARQLFDQLTGGNHQVLPNGQLLGPNGHRLRLAPDGRWRVEIPAHDGLLHETVHVNP